MVSVSPKKALKPRASSWLFIFTLVIFLWWCSAYIQLNSAYTQTRTYHLLLDDALISARYAWNWTHHGQLVWNQDEFVEGYTNPLQVALMALPMLVFDKSESLLFVRWMGAVWILVGAFSLSAIACRIWTSGWSALLGFFCGLTYYPLIYWALGGMETGPLFGILTLTLWLTLITKGYSKSGGRGSLLGLSLGLCFGFLYLCRPDGVLFAIPCLLYLRRQRATTALSLVILFIFIACHLLWRHSYYGEWMPNTYTLKMSGWSLAFRIQNGWGFIRRFLIQTWPLWLIASWSVWCHRRAEMALLAAFLPLSTLYQISVGGDPWPVWRIMAPSVPLALLCGALGTILSLRQMKNSSRNRSLAATVLAVALGVMLMKCMNGPFTAEWSLNQTAPEIDQTLEQMHRAIILRAILRPSDRIALLHAGCVAYYTDFRAVDILGKCDKHIARLAPDLSGHVSWAGMKSVPGHNKYDLNYSLGLFTPTYTEVIAWGNRPAMPAIMSQYARIYIDGVRFYLLKSFVAYKFPKLMR